MSAKSSRGAFAVLILANVVYATAYSTARVAMNGVPPATLAFVRLFIAGLALLPFFGVRGEAPLSRRDFWSVAGMGIIGLGAAFWLGNVGIAWSSSTDAALLVVVEPVALMLLGPALLGETLSRREAAGAALAVVGSALVVFNGVPGVSARLLPHWRGDVILILGGLAFAVYSLLSRPVLARADAGRVTVLSMFWGAAAIFPLAAREWMAGRRPVWTFSAAAATIYLTLAVTALGFFLWNWALERVETSRAAIFLTSQPILGALLGVLWLKERVTVFTLSGGALIVAGLVAAFWPARANALQAFDALADKPAEIIRGGAGSEL
ncbi:MAG TPA: DMT family transporter [Elusimicrobiota bacterium]|nr:DMT family transporter [Elusimicrobiota bacterium]